MKPQDRTRAILRSGRIPKKVRDEVLSRDGNACHYCGATTPPLTIDHRIPVSLGGGSEVENLRAACRSCNSRKGASLPAGPNPYAERTSEIMQARIAAARCPVHDDAGSQVAGWWEFDDEYTLCKCSRCTTIIRYYADGHGEMHEADQGYSAFDWRRCG